MKSGRRFLHLSSFSDSNSFMLAGPGLGRGRVQQILPKLKMIDVGVYNILFHKIIFIKLTLCQYVAPIKIMLPIGLSFIEIYCEKWALLG